MRILDAGCGSGRNLVYLLRGGSVITISGTPIRTLAGESVLMPADQPHALVNALKAVTRFEIE